MSEPHNWLAFITLLGLEIVLNVDNIILISILSAKLPPEQQQRARYTGLFLAMFIRIGLLCSLAWLTKLTAPLFSILGHGFSGRDLILLLGGLFLIAKSTQEIHHSLEGSSSDNHEKETRKVPTFVATIAQILLLDIVFSLDSVITAIGMANDLGIMVSAVVISVAFMMFFANSISNFVEARPTVKMLAISFLLMIGVVLVAEGWGQHVSKGYIYFAMGFSLFVEMLNLKIRGTSGEPVKLRESSLKND